MLTLHVWEEWVIPGGFHVIYNLGSTYPDRYPMSELTDMLTNFLGELVWFIATETNHYGVKLGIATLLFGYFEFIIHNFLCLQSLNAYGKYGQITYYAPGMITALLCWLPLAIGLTVYFNRHRPGIKAWFQGVGVLILLSLAIVQLPETMLKTPNNPYRFDNYGYYQKYKTQIETHH